VEPDMEISDDYRKGDQQVKISSIYSFNGGIEFMNEYHNCELKQIQTVIEKINARKFKTKVSKEKKMKGKLLYSQVKLNLEFKRLFGTQDINGGWERKRIDCDYAPLQCKDGFVSQTKCLKGFREIDFVKSKVGVEVQFGKYSFMVYDILGKIPVFKKLGLIDCGVEIVPTKRFAESMCSGVSCYEQLVWDLNMIGNTSPSVPVVVIGISDK
jgi:hypothetical protein